MEGCRLAYRTEERLSGGPLGKAVLRGSRLLLKFGARAVSHWEDFPDLGGAWYPKT